MMDDLKSAILALPRVAKRTFALAFDIMICALAVRISFYLRLEIWFGWERAQLIATIASIAIATPIFIASGLYRAIFRFGGNSLLRRVVGACSIYGIAYAFLFTAWSVTGVPRSIGVIQPLVLLVLIIASRTLASAFLGEPYSRARARSETRTVAIYGAGAAGRQLSQALDRSSMTVCAFIDDDPSLIDHIVLGKRVYSSNNAAKVVERHGATDILLALPSISRRRRMAIIEELRALPVAVRTMPGMTALARGLVVTKDFIELEIDDLLGRDPVDPDEDLLSSKVRQRVVAVTGAGGSIGSELCRQVLAREPVTLLLIENSESSLYGIHKELEEQAHRLDLVVQIVPLLASVCDSGRIMGIFNAWRPQTIYHAAAYKHVPLVEYNPVEGLSNNTFGSVAVAKAAIASGVADFVFISTDKAVRPTNVMGATKRLAELALQALAAENPTTCISMVRFGNVLGSSGSVVPLFREQIRKGGPITLTHPDVNRYFMTIPEAAQLVIQAGAMAKGGEVFVLDMGDPVRVIDLARRMVELSGLTVQDEHHPDGDIRFEIVGLRPGEKLHEELLIGNDPSPTGHPRIMMAHEHFIPWAQLEQEFSGLSNALERFDITDVLRRLRGLVREYNPQTRVHDLVFQKITEG